MISVSMEFIVFSADTVMSGEIMLKLKNAYYFTNYFTVFIYLLCYLLITTLHAPILGFRTL